MSDRTEPRVDSANRPVTDPAAWRRVSLVAFGRRMAGFTLVELLAVVVLMAILASGTGLALRRPADVVALQAAQRTLASLCSAARSRAALTGRNARLVVAAVPEDSEYYLHFLEIVHEDPSGSNRWRAQDGGTYLPRGVYVVPSASAAVPGNPTWPASRRSTALSSAASAMTINDVAAGSFYYLQFTPRGTTGGGYLLLTSGRYVATAAGTTLELDNPDDLRGVLVRASGALTSINDAGAFAP